MTDLNGNRLLDGPNELGAFLQTVGGAGFVRVDPNLKRPYGEELSGHYEQEVITGLTARGSYVYKNVRNDWAEVDVARIGEYTRPQNVVDPGVDGVAGTGDDRDAVAAGSVADGIAERSRVHESRRLQVRLSHGRSGAEPPLQGQLDGADVVRLHLARAAQRRDVDHERGGLGRLDQDVQLAAELSAASATAAAKTRRSGTTS